MSTKIIPYPWWETIKPQCCEECGNYKNRDGSTHQLIPQSARCWKFYNKENDCYKNPNKATYEQLRKRSIIIRNPDPTKECSICRKLMRGRYVKRIPCGHHFHLKCLKEWETRKYSCPMFPCIIRTPILGLIFEEKNAYYTRKITVYKGE